MPKALTLGIECDVNLDFVKSQGGLFHLWHETNMKPIGKKKMVLIHYSGRN
jgi:hypothetical protein